MSSEIYWKRGIPTEAECRECYLIAGVIVDGSPEISQFYKPGTTKPRSWLPDGWYAAVRILHPHPPAEDPEDLCPITGLPECVMKSVVSDIQKSLSKSQVPEQPVIRESRKTEGPQPGQFFVNEIGKRRQIIGVTSKGKLAVEFDCGDVLSYDVSYVTANWKHLPWCKSFTDTEPEPPKKKQRKWVFKHGEAWIDDSRTAVVAMNDWTCTNETREVPVV